jgi:hypothetical protein
MKYYILHVEGDIEPSLKGPYKTSGTRDLAARRLRQKTEGKDGVFWMDVTDGKAPVVGSYSGGFLAGVKGFIR